MIRAVALVHQKLLNKNSSVQLIDSYIKMSQTSSSYGATMFDGIISGKKVLIGVVFDGIIVFLSDVMEDVQFYPINEIRNFCAANDSVYIYFKNNKNLQIKTGRPERLVELLAGYYYLAGEKSDDVEIPINLSLIQKSNVLHLNYSRKEIIFLDNRLKYFSDIIYTNAQDNGLTQANALPKKVMSPIRVAISNGSNLNFIHLESSDVSMLQYTIFADSLVQSFRARGGKEVKETLNAQGISISDNTGLASTIEFAQATNKIFKSPIALKRIFMSNIGLTEEVAKDLCEGFRASNSLDHLSIGRNPKIGSSLTQILRSINRNSLHILDIRNCGITKENANQVLRAIEDFQNLNTLIIKDNDLSSVTTEFTKIMLKAKKLTALDVRNCNLSKDALFAIFKGLVDNRVLKDLRISGNEGLSSAIGYICDCYTEKVVKIPPIARLDVASESIDSGDVKKIVKSMKLPQCHINALDISGCKLKEDFGKMTETFLEFEKTDKCITQLTCTNCQLSDKSIPKIVDYLKQTTRLTKFKCGFNTSLFKKGEFGFIAEMIKGNQTLYNIHLSGMNFSSDHVDEIFNAIANHPNIVKLALDSNPVVNYLDKISGLLVADSKLQVLKMRKLESITKDELCDWLNHGLPDSSALKVEKIVLTNNNLTSSDIKEAIEKHPSVHFVL